MKAGAHLGGLAAGRLALVGAAAWGLATLVGGLGWIGAGLGAVPASAWAQLAIVGLPAALTVAIPVATAWTTLDLLESGEARAAVGAGMHPASLTMWCFLLPVVPLVLAAGPLVREAVPASTAALADGARRAAARSPAFLARALHDRGGALAVDEVGVRLLVPVGAGRAVATRAAAIRTGPDGPTLADGEATVFEADGGRRRARFASLDLDLAVTAGSLGERGEAELSSDFLELGMGVWLAARRERAPAPDLRARAESALARRAALPWALWLATLPATCVLMFAAGRPAPRAVVVALCVLLPGLALAVGVPRCF